MAARSSLLRRPTPGARPARRTSSVVAALPALAPRLVRLARHDHPGSLLTMRVLLVSANQERSPDPVAPLGLCYVATAAADAGHEVSVVDLCFSEDVFADVRSAVATGRPEAIGVSLRNVDNCAWPDTVSYLPHYRRVVDACRT